MFTRFTAAALVGTALSLASPSLADDGSRTSLWNALRPMLDAVKEGPEPRGFLVSKRQQWEGYLDDVLAGGEESYHRMQERAMDRLIAARRPDTCPMRRERLDTAATDALRYIELSQAIYASTHGLQMAAVGEAKRQISPDIHAFQAGNGAFYAELHVEADRRAVLVFRGTRLASRKDILTNVGHFLGADMPYYDWAAYIAASVRAEYPDWSIVATGHSLGGGLAMWAAASTPGVRAVAFNPSGLSFALWDAIDPSVQQRVPETIVAFVATTRMAVDPVSAMPLSGMSVIPGRVYAVPVDDRNDPKVRHSLPPLTKALQQVHATGAGGDACDYDLGFVAMSPASG